MEDFLWIILIGAGLIFSVINKAGRKAQEGQQPGKGNPHEAWPTVFGIPLSDDESEEKTVRNDDVGKMTPRQPQEQAFEDGMDAEPAYTDESQYTTPQEHLDMPAEGRYQAAAKTSNDLMVAKSFTKMTGSNGPEETVEEGLAVTEVQSAGDLLSDFNLEKAVIYSEILKPKFDE